MGSQKDELSLSAARRVAVRLAAFEISVIAYAPFVSAEDAAAIGVKLVDLDNLLRRADFASLHAPLNDKTRGMISAKKIALMKPTAYFTNTAHADPADEAALAANDLPIEWVQSYSPAGAYALEMTLRR